MKKIIGASALFFLLSGGVFAEKVIYVHGMSLTTDNSSCQDQSSCDYWTADPVGDHVFVGYDGRRNPFSGVAASGSVRLLAMLNKYCRADQGQSCRIISDSMGGYTTAGTIAMYNTTGVYNITSATNFVSAEGGSEIANLGDTAIEILMAVFGVSNSQSADDFVDNWDAIDGLVTSYARGLFDHNRTNGTVFYQVPANKTIWIADPFLPGEDDSLVAFHSSCAYRTTGAFSQCMGQKIRSCSWCFWQKKKLVEPFEGRNMHPLVPITGVDYAHAPAHNDPTYYNL